MTDLVEAYQRNEIHRYEQVLESHKAEILSDPFIREHIDEVTRNVRTEALTKLIKPYTRFTLKFISNQLQISVPEVQEIIGFLILDKKIRGKINQSEGTVEVESKSDVERMESMREWSTQSEHLWQTVMRVGEILRSDDPGMTGTGGLVKSEPWDDEEDESSVKTKGKGKESMLETGEQ